MRLLILFLLISVAAADIDDFVKFVQEDETDKNVAIYDKYMCLDYSLDLIKNASLAGIDVMLVNVPPCEEAPKGHYLVEVDGFLFDPIDEEFKSYDFYTVIDPNKVVRKNVREIYLVNDQLSDGV